MSSPHDHDDELTPEQEAEAQAFAEQLEHVSGVHLEESVGWLTIGDAQVQMTAEQVDQFRDAAFDVALTKLYAESPEGRTWQSRLAITTTFVGFSALAAAAAFAAVRGILGF